MGLDIWSVAVCLNTIAQFFLFMYFILARIGNKMNISKIFTGNISTKSRVSGIQCCLNNPIDDNRLQTVNLNDNANSYYNKISFSGVHKMNGNSDKHEKEYYLGCILGGAVGDAFGAPVEGYNKKSIDERYGENGLRYLIKRNGFARITDDTQMTLFTIDGLMKSLIKNGNLDEKPDIGRIHGSYLDWYRTQTSKKADDKDGLMSVDELFAKRFPGVTCMNSLESAIIGTTQDPINDSKGSGGVMRVAPVGLLYYKNPKLAFEVGAECAALTHGNPSAYLAAGVHAAIIAHIINGENIENAIAKSLDILKEYDSHEELLQYIQKAIKLSKQEDIEPAEAIENIGSGNRGDEAIAIAIYCALKSPDNFKNAIIMSTNHSGDSDTTAAITGNILGAYLGTDNIPSSWLNNIELMNTISDYAQDLYITAAQEKEFQPGKPTLQDRIDADRFYFTRKPVSFYPKDIELMKSMDIKERNEYKRKLKSEGKYRRGD